MICTQPYNVWCRAVEFTMNGTKEELNSCTISGAKEGNIHSCTITWAREWNVLYTVVQ